MNTQGLTKMYDQLTPRERLPLIVAASVRADTVERARLVDSAAMVTFAVPPFTAWPKRSPRRPVSTC
jgi:hypothetical protein